MNKTRLEAFSDGVIAIIITIMVLELKVPHGTDFATLKPLVPVFLSYVLSFIYLAIYWNNHHHMLHTCHKVTGAHAVGEPAPAVLALADPVRDRLDGREPFRRDADRALRVRAADGGHRLLLAASRRSSPRRARTRSCRQAVGRDWKGIVSPILYVIRDPHRVHLALGVEGDLRARRTDVARARPADREGARAPGGLMNKPIAAVAAAPRPGRCAAGALRRASAAASGSRRPT